MTQTGYSNAIVNAMLSWLKGMASWVLKLFNLSAGFSPLKFLADNWLKLLIILLITGVAVDLLVWLIRWRPHWVWFHKKRVIINDANFFARERFIDDSDAWDAERRPERPKRNWEESDFVVPSAQRRRREAREREEAQRRKARAARVKSMQLGGAKPGETTDVFTDSMFNVNAKQKFSDKYEDEVFNVVDLPVSEEEAQSDRPQEAHGSAERPAPAQRGRKRARTDGAARSERRPSMARSEKRHVRKRVPSAQKKR